MKVDVLIVTKDRAEFGIYKNVRRALIKLGVRIAVVAEGLSMREWAREGVEIYGGLPRPDAVDQNTGVRTDINLSKALRELHPRVVMIGLAIPIHLGKHFGVAVEEWNVTRRSSDRIITGFVEDVWGVSSRSEAIPDFICTLDPWGADHLLGNEKYRERTRVYPTGNPAWDDLLEVRPVERVERAVFGRPHVVLLAGQDYSTTPVIDGLFKAVSRIQGAVIIPRLHPKYTQVTEETLAAEQDSVKHAEYKKQLRESTMWRAKLSQPPKGVDIHWVGDDVTMHELILSAHYVVGIYTNALVEAALLGRVPVSWISDIGRRSMANALGGLSRFPLVESGCAIEVDSPDLYCAAVPHPGSPKYTAITARAQSLLKPGSNTDNVVRVISSYLN